MKICKVIRDQIWRLEDAIYEGLGCSQMEKELKELDKLFDFWNAVEQGVFIGKYNSLKYKILHFVFKTFFKDKQ